MTIESPSMEKITGGGVEESKHLVPEREASWEELRPEEIKDTIEIQEEINEMEGERSGQRPETISQLYQESRQAREELAEAEIESDKYKVLTGQISKVFKREEREKAKQEHESAQEKYDQVQDKLLSRFLEKAQTRWAEKGREGDFQTFRNELIFKGFFGREQERLARAKQEMLPAQEKKRLNGLFKKMGGSYAKLPKKYRWALSAGIGTAVAFGLGGVAAPALLGYAGFRYGRAALASLSAAGVKKLGDNLEKVWLKKRGRGAREEKVKKSLIEQAEGIDSFEQMNEILARKRKERNTELAELIKQQKYWQVGKMAATIGAGGGIAFCAGHFDMLGSEAEAAGVEEQLGIEEESGVVRMPMPPRPEDVEVPPEIKEPVPEPEELTTPVERPAGEPHKPIDLEAEAEAVEVPKPEKAYQFPEEVEMISPERGLAANFTLELGQGEVPPQLERVFHMMAADHMDKVTDASGMFTEEHGAKSLNMAANLVKLAEGHNIAGIDHEDFAKVVSWDAKANSLEIKDHVQFNQMVDKLENHADKLWQRGVLQKGAVAYLDDIKKGTWEKIIQAEGLDKVGETETGIEGHDGITSEQIMDFDKSEMVQEAEKAMEEAKKVIEEVVPPEVVEKIMAAPEVGTEEFYQAQQALEDVQISPEERMANIDKTLETIPSRIKTLEDLSKNPNLSPEAQRMLGREISNFKEFQEELTKAKGLELEPLSIKELLPPKIFETDEFRAIMEAKDFEALSAERIKKINDLFIKYLEYDFETFKSLPENLQVEKMSEVGDTIKVLGMEAEVAPNAAQKALDMRNAGELKMLDDIWDKYGPETTEVKEAAVEAVKTAKEIAIEARAMAMENSGLDPDEWESIKGTKVGKLLEEIPSKDKAWAIWRGEVEGEGIELPHHGAYGSREFGRHIKLTEFIREKLPLVDKSPEAREMTVDEVLKNIAGGKLEGAKEEVVNIEL